MSLPSQSYSQPYVFLFFPKTNNTKKMMRITTKMPVIPCAMRVKDLPNSVFMLPSPYSKPGTNPRITPPAMTDAICPATFAPTACIKRWF